MSTFTIGQYGSDGNDALRGQSFTPNVPGSGSGGPGTATQVFIQSLSLGYPTSNTTGRARRVYIYSQELTDPDQIGQSQYLVAQSADLTYSDSTGLFGAGTYSRTWMFGAGAFLPGSKYYAYFDLDQNARIQDGSPYAGGNAYDTDVSPVDVESAQFQIAFYT